jgi:hypothetical protein
LGGVRLGVVVLAGGVELVVLGAVDPPPEDDEPVEDAVDPVPALVVEPVVAPVLATATAFAGVAAAVVVVVVPFCGVNGLRPRPASLETEDLVWTEIAGSAVPVE